MIRSWALLVAITIGMFLAAIAASLFHYSVPLFLGWGMCAGTLAGIAAQKSQPKRTRVLCAALAAALAATAVSVFATHGGT